MGSRSAPSRARSGCSTSRRVVSTAREPGKRRAVTDLVPSRRRLYPVGRLDADSTGLILLTNDGELANRLTHPRYGVERTYRATLRKPPTDAQLARLRSGVDLDDGPTRKAVVRRSGKRGIEITMKEGRNRQVRRMVEAVGNDVVALKRIRFGSLGLERLRRRRSQARRTPGEGALEGFRSRWVSDFGQSGARRRPMPTTRSRSSRLRASSFPS